MKLFKWKQNIINVLIVLTAVSVKTSATKTSLSTTNIKGANRKSLLRREVIYWEEETPTERRGDDDEMEVDDEFYDNEMNTPTATNNILQKLFENKDDRQDFKNEKRILLWTKTEDEFFLQGTNGNDMMNEHNIRNEDDLMEYLLEQELIKQGKLEPSSEEENTIDPHPMRMKEWKIKFRNNSGRCSKDNLLKDMNLLEFAPNGYVRVISEEGDEKTTKAVTISTIQKSSPLPPQPPTSSIVKDIGIGKWTLDSAHGLLWNIPVQVVLKVKEYDNSSKDTFTDATTLTTTTINLYFAADIHLNKFRSYPHMVRGIVTRDRFSTISASSNSNIKGRRKNVWFRPVIGTFIGQGYGNDTLDVSSYKRTRQQIIDR